MQQEIEALLALQEDDLKIREIEAQISALDPQLADFDKRRAQVLASLARAESAVAAEHKKQGELQARLAQHKQMQERNLHQLDDVKRMREATAATAQVESTRRLMAEDETEIGDEESLYEVEVTLPYGSQVDVQLDERFDIVGVEQDGTTDDHD